MRMARATSARFLLPAALFALLLAACANVQKPDGWSPPVREDATLYASLHGGKVSALDPDTYEERWEFPAEKEFACGDGAVESHNLDGIYGAPAIGDTMIYVGAYDGSAYAVNKDDGACAWEFKTDDVIVGGVVLGDAGLYVPSSDGYLYLVDPDTGLETKRFAAGDLWATPLLAEDALYQPTMEGKLWKLDPATLDPIWDSPFDTSAALLTAPGGGAKGPDRIVVGGIGRTLYSIDAATGEEQWSFKAGNWFWGQPFVDKTGVYASNLDGKVYALNPETGDKLWDFDTGATIRAGVAWTGDAVIVVNNNGDVYSLDAATGEPNWGPTELDETVYADPVAIDDQVFIVTRSGAVITIDGEGRPTTVVDG